MHKSSVTWTAFSLHVPVELALPAGLRLSRFDAEQFVSSAAQDSRRLHDEELWAGSTLISVNLKLPCHAAECERISAQRYIASPAM